MDHFSRCPKKKESDFVNQRAYFNAHPFHYVPMESYHPIGFNNSFLFYDDYYPTPELPTFQVPISEFFDHHSSDLNDSKIRSCAEVEIASIERKLQNFQGSDLRQELKRLMLFWHPDKAQTNHSLDIDVITEVFLFVNERWKKYNSENCHRHWVFDWPFLLPTWYTSNRYLQDINNLFVHLKDYQISSPKVSKIMKLFLTIDNYEFCLNYIHHFKSS